MCFTSHTNAPTREKNKKIKQNKTTPSVERQAANYKSINEKNIIILWSTNINKAIPKESQPQRQPIGPNPHGTPKHTRQHPPPTYTQTTQR